jgi:hypothetical protein
MTRSDSNLMVDHLMFYRNESTTFQVRRIGSDSCFLPRLPGLVIPEIDIWRGADLMLKRYGEKALEESATRADELATDGDHDVR